MATPIENNTTELEEILRTVNELPASVDLSEYVKKSKLTVTLSASGWSNLIQSVTASGVTADNDLVISPASSSHDAYVEAGVRCTAQTSNRLTFICTEKPSSNLSVNVLILT